MTRVVRWIKQRQKGWRDNSVGRELAWHARGDAVKLEENLPGIHGEVQLSRQNTCLAPKVLVSIVSVAGRGWGGPPVSPSTGKVKAGVAEIKVTQEDREQPGTQKTSSQTNKCEQKEIVNAGQ